MPSLGVGEHEVDLAVLRALRLVADDPATEWKASHSSSSCSSSASKTLPSASLFRSASNSVRGYIRAIGASYGR